jgi:hypothetical protein
MMELQPLKAPRLKSAPDSSAQSLVLERFAPEETFKTKVYAALKQAIINMDIYGSREPSWIDARRSRCSSRRAS